MIGSTTGSFFLKQLSLTCSGESKISFRRPPHRSRVVTNIALKTKFEWGYRALSTLYKLGSSCAHVYFFQAGHCKPFPTRHVHGLRKIKFGNVLPSGPFITYLSITNPFYSQSHLRNFAQLCLYYCAAALESASSRSSLPPTKYNFVCLLGGQ